MYACSPSSCVRNTSQNVSLRLGSRIMKRAKPRGRRTGLSQKERRTIGLFRLPRLSITYEEALPMNKLWQAYMHRFLNFDHIREKEYVGNAYNVVGSFVFRNHIFLFPVEVVQSKKW